MYMHYKTYETYGAGNQLIVDPDGFAKLVRHLAAQTFVRGENDPRLLLHETVRQVQLYKPEREQQQNPDSSVSNAPLNELESVYVRTAEGHEFVARYCIITFSVFAWLSPFSWGNWNTLLWIFGTSICGFSVKFRDNLSFAQQNYRWQPRWQSCECTHYCMYKYNHLSRSSQSRAVTVKVLVTACECNGNS